MHYLPIKIKILKKTLALLFFGAIIIIIHKQMYTISVHVIMAMTKKKPDLFHVQRADGWCKSVEALGGPFSEPLVINQQGKPFTAVRVARHTICFAMQVATREYTLVLYIQRTRVFYFPISLFYDWLLFIFFYYSRGFFYEQSVQFFRRSIHAAGRSAGTGTERNAVLR